MDHHDAIIQNEADLYSRGRKLHLLYQEINQK